MDNVNHPSHYCDGFSTRPIECIDITRYLPFALGNAVKYVWRAGAKGEEEQWSEDIDKATWYVKEWRMHPTPVPELKVAQAVWGLLALDGKVVNGHASLNDTKIMTIGSVLSLPDRYGIPMRDNRVEISHLRDLKKFLAGISSAGARL